MSRFARVASVAVGALLLTASRGTGVAQGQARASADDRRPDLPLVEVPARRAGGHTLVLLMSGDGNWAGTVQALAGTLADSGYAVVGLEARNYMSKPRTADGNAQDVERILRYYLRHWARDSIVILGFSRGADWAPLVTTRLPHDLRGRVRLMVMLSPGMAASYEFKWSDLVFDTKRPTDIPLLPALTALRGLAMLCIYGVDDSRNAICPVLPSGLATVVARPGGHRPAEQEHLSDPIVAALGGADRGTRRE